MIDPKILKQAMYEAMSTKEAKVITGDNYIHAIKNSVNFTCNSPTPPAKYSGYTPSVSTNTTATIYSPPHPYYTPSKGSILNYLEQYNDNPLLLPPMEKQTKQILLKAELSPILSAYVYGMPQFRLTTSTLPCMHKFFKTYLEGLAIKLATSKHKSPLVTFMDNKEFGDSISYQDDLWQYSGYDNYYKEKHYPRRESSSLIELIGLVCNCNQSKASSIVATLTGVNFENLFTFTQKTHAADYSANSNTTFQYTPSEINDFKCIDYKKIVGYSWQTIGYICTYKNEHCIFNLMASISNQKLILGNVKPTAYFINHTEIDNNQDATILFFQNYNQARAFEKYLEKCITPPKDIIVTSHISNDINLLDWTLLRNRKVVLVLETSQYGFNMLFAYQKNLADQNASFSIYPYPLIFKELNNGQALPEETVQNQLSLLEQNLLNNATFVDDCQIPGNLTKKIVEKALTPKAFHEWFKQCTEEDKAQSKPEPPAVSSLAQLSFCRQRTQQSILTDYSQIPATAFFGHGNITILHARKDTGKSLAALEIAKALSLNTGCFSFINGTKTQKTLALDGETTEDTLDLRQFQLQCQKEAPIILSLKALSQTKEEPWCSFNLSDKNHRKILEHKLREEKINFLILDNITCLVGDKGIISEKIAQEVMTWATELSNDISILIIHHTNEEKNKISGSDIWRRRCTNELQLIGKKDLETLPDLPEEIKNIAHSCDGAFFGMRCNSSKSCSILKDKIIWASLPLGASKWNLHAVTDEYGKVLKDLSHKHHEEILPENTTPMSPDPTEQAKLSDYDKIYNQFGFEPFSRSDIDELFGCEKDKSHKIIEKLGARVEKTGNGNQTRYKLKPQN